MAAVYGIAEGTRVLKGGMPAGEEKKFDNRNGARGINPREVLKIAQRNGVYPNKDGILPAEPNNRIMDYVRRFANNPSDVEEFRLNWYRTVERQHNQKRERIMKESKESLNYDKFEQYFRNSIIPNLSGKTISLKISHWMYLDFELHEEQMLDILDNTIWGQFVVNCSLRPNPNVAYSNIEYYEVRLPNDVDMGEYEFVQLYKWCCTKRGWDHML